jgi:DNA-binding NtrC family response regulator
MLRQPFINTNRSGNLTGGSNGEISLPQSNFVSPNLPSLPDSNPTVEEARIASLKVLAMTLLQQVESLEKQIATNNLPELNLQREVHRFEAAIIRSALAKTGGRQRRAARLLGVKVTTLNTKIKRHRILIDDQQPNDKSDLLA